MTKIYKKSLKLKKFRTRKTLKFNGGARPSARPSARPKHEPITINNIPSFNEAYDEFYTITDRNKTDIKNRHNELRRFFLECTTLDNRKYLTELQKNLSQITDTTQKQKIIDFLFFFNYFLNNQQEDFNAIYIGILKIVNKNKTANIDKYINQFNLVVLKNLLSILEFDNTVPVPFDSTTRTIKRLRQIIKYKTTRNDGGSPTPLQDIEVLELQEMLSNLPPIPIHNPELTSELPSVPTHTPGISTKQPAKPTRVLGAAFTTSGITSHK